MKSPTLTWSFLYYIIDIKMLIWPQKIVIIPTIFIVSVVLFPNKIVQYLYVLFSNQSL